jgi:uncharacterized repeat protein (TIGR03803 family)
MSETNWVVKASGIILLFAVAAILTPAQTPQVVAPAGPLFTTLHTFDRADGSSPRATLVQATDGNLYGTAALGGSTSCSFGCGTVFKITPGGIAFTLHTFSGVSTSGLIQGNNGDLYGTTYSGGTGDCYKGCGAVFQVSTTGSWTILHSFCSRRGCPDGQYSNAELVQAADGTFYGTTVRGGADYRGTVFSIAPTGEFTTLHSFDATYGGQPLAGLVEDTDGTFYGTTSAVQANAYGTTFSLSVGLGPVVNPQPAYGQVGTAINILGTNLTGATSVTFNGTAAVFALISRSLIATTVPTGATTGTVQVITPKGMLSSNIAFLVRP